MGDKDVIRYNPKIKMPAAGDYFSFAVDNEKEKARSEGSYRNTDEIEESYTKVKIGGITLNLHAARVKKTGKDYLEWGLE